MKNLGFNVLNTPANRPISEELQENATWSYDPTKDDGYTGREAIEYSVSIRDRTEGGKKGAKVTLNGEELQSVYDVLDSLNPYEDLESLPPHVVINRTFESDGESVSFKTSYAKHSRTVKIPIKDWREFLKYMEACADSVDKAVDYYRSVVTESKEAEVE